MNGAQHGDNRGKTGGNRKGSGITLCLSENPLTIDFLASLLVICSGERMPTGAMRTELRLDPHRSRDTAGSERTEFTATSDRVRTAPSGETRTTESRHRIRATGRGVRSNRVERSLRGASGHGDLQGRSGNRTSRRGDRTERRPSGRGTETGQWCRAEGSGATPTGLREDGSDWHQLLMARETGSA